jgi:hypothetical protein
MPVLINWSRAAEQACGDAREQEALLDDFTSGRRRLVSRNDFAWLLSAAGIRGAAVEVGVARGEFSGVMLAGWEGCTAYTQVDTWRDMTREHGASASHVTMGAAGHEKSYCEVHFSGRRLHLPSISPPSPLSLPSVSPPPPQVRAHFSDRGLYGGKVRQLRRASENAAGLFRDESLAFVYIDGNHYSPWVERDLELYWPKLRPGGLFAGHDFEWPWLVMGGRRTWPQTGAVKQAVEAFARMRGLRFHLTRKQVHPACCPSWYMFKPRSSAHRRER